jgi:hypothetical protein
MSGYPMEPQLRLSHANATMVGLRIFSWHGTATAFVVVIATPDWRSRRERLRCSTLAFV